MTATAASSRCIPMSCSVLDHEIFDEILEDEKGRARRRSRHRTFGRRTGSRSSGSTRRRSRRNWVQPSRRIRRQQLWGAVGAVFSCWMNHRAITYRRLHDIPESWGTAVNVQAMVFGNMGDTSATGVAFTRNPSTGEKKLYGEFLVNAQGEDVVAGIRTPQNITEAARIDAGSDKPSMQKLMPEAFADFVDISDAAGKALPRHAGPRIHHRARQTVDAADPLRQAHRQGGDEDRRRDGGGRADRRRGGDRCASSRPRSTSCCTRPSIPNARRDSHRRRPAGLARCCDRRDRLHLRRSRGDEDGQGRKVILVRIETSPEDIHGMHAARGHPDHPRRHDQPCGGGGARHGQALRVGRRLAARRLPHRHADGDGRRPSARATSSPSTAPPARC